MRLNIFGIILILTCCTRFKNSKSSECKILYNYVNVNLKLYDGNLFKDSMTTSLIDSSKNYFLCNLTDVSSCKKFVTNSKLFNDLKSDTIVFLTSYFDSFIKKNDTLDLNNAKAIGVYYYKKSHFHFDLYIRFINDFNLVEELSGPTNTLTMANFLKVGSDIIFKNAEFRNAILIRKKGAIYDTNSEDLLSKRLKKFKN